MCQYACSPDPKAVMVWTRFRLTTKQTEARAVRKAVNVLACRIPTGCPVAEKSVMAPVGLILGLLAAASCSADWGGVRVITI